MPTPKGIKFDSSNYRKHPEKNKRVIKKSVEELGAGRSILLDNDNQIIAGNGVMEQWGSKPVRIIETDGTELIAVKRKDLSPNDEKRKQLALIDNHASDTSEFDIDLINHDFDSDFLNGWDFENNLLMPSEDELIGENKDKPPTIKITFKTLGQLQQAETDIQELLDRKYKGAYFSISAGEL